MSPPTTQAMNKWACCNQISVGSAGETRGALKPGIGWTSRVTEAPRTIRLSVLSNSITTYRNIQGLRPALPDNFEICSTLVPLITINAKARRAT